MGSKYVFVGIKFVIRHIHKTQENESLKIFWIKIMDWKPFGEQQFILQLWQTINLIRTHSLIIIYVFSL